MAQHFLISAAARTLSLASVARMSDEEAERVFVRLRWADNGGNPYCPHCGCTTVYMARCPSGSGRLRCEGCRKDFSVTSGTLFAFHKMPLRSYLMAIAIFANEVKGKSMLALSRDLGTQYKTAWLLSASGVMEARGGGFGYDDGSRRSGVAGEHEGFLSSWPQRTRSTSHPCSTTRSASPWCASTAGQRASVALDAAATR